MTVGQGSSRHSVSRTKVVMSSKPIPQGSLVLLWAGEDPAVHAALLEELEAEEIPFSDKSLGDAPDDPSFAD